MIYNLKRWLENIWKLKEIFDKYLPLVRAHREAVLELAQEWKRLKEESDKQRAELDQLKSKVEG